MKLNEVTAVGFYKPTNDTNYEVIFEVFENTNEKWLKECPDQKLLVDEWIYDYTDDNDIKIYGCHGTIYPVQNEDSIEVEKIDKQYQVFGNMGASLRELKPTYKEKCQNTIEQIKKDIVRLEDGNYDKNDFICDLKDYLRMLGDEDD